MKGEAPLFSVIIPTKNRSSIVGMAIESVLRQTFGDFEIIVSDNDDSPTATREAVEMFSDPRIHYYRTSGNLSMPDNWEFAISRVSGGYITLLEDKQVLYPDALETLHKVLAGGDVKCVVWMNDKLDDTFIPPVFYRYTGSGKVNEKPTNDILKQLCLERIDYPSLPRMMNSLVSTDFVRFAQRESGLNRYFDLVNPDFVSAFIQLNYLDRITFVDKSLNITGGRALSNGLSGRKKGETARRFINEVGESRFFDFVPLKIVTANNAIMNDYNRIRSTLDGNLRRHEITPEAYMAMCYADIIENEKLGTDMRGERKLWKELLNTMDPAVKRQVRQRTKSIAFRRRISGAPILSPLLNVVRKLRKSQGQVEMVTGYQNAFEAAGFITG